MSLPSPLNLREGTKSIHIIRPHIIKLRRSANTIIAKPSIVLLILIHDRHDSKIVRRIISPTDNPFISIAAIAWNRGEVVVDGIVGAINNLAVDGRRVAARNDSEGVGAGIRVGSADWG
jgi:hypothetical protein